MAEDMDGKRLHGADFMRAVACLVVLFHHLAQRLSPAEISPPLELFRTFANNGTFGVAIFFVLSGYLLARPFWPALEQGQPLPSPRTYAMRRAARILPGFWLALTATFLAGITIFNVRLDGELLLRFVAGFLLVADWHWVTFFPVEINGPLWSISFEATCYALLPICFALPLIFARRAPWRGLAIWLGIIGLVLGAHWLFLNFYSIDDERRGWAFGLVGGAKGWMPRYNPFAFFAMFAIGSLAAGLQLRWARASSLVFDALAFVALGLIVLVFVVHADAADASAYGWLGIPYAFPSLVLAVGAFLATAPSSRYAGAVLDNRLTRYVARVSFGIYVWHYLVIEIVRKYWAPDFRMFSLTDPWSFVTTSAAITALTVLVAHCSFYLLERPVIVWARGRERGRTTTFSEKPALALEKAP
jgi:peptidoglycan/LPS O-acetylase OafA/YrhL